MMSWNEHVVSFMAVYSQWEHVGLVSWPVGMWSVARIVLVHFTVSSRPYMHCCQRRIAGALGGEYRSESFFNGPLDGNLDETPLGYPFYNVFLSVGGVLECSGSVMEV